MKRYLLTLLLAACSANRQPAPAPPPMTAVEPSKVVMLEDAASIYDLGIPMTDAAGAAIQVDATRGHVTVVAMIYASCTVACPVTIADIKQTLDVLPPSTDVRVLLVTMDPAHDTPAVLTELAKQQHLDDRWTLAAPSESDARMLAATIGVKYRKLDGGQFAHNMATTVLDRDGHPIARAEQFGQHHGLARVIAEESARRPTS
jgi:protein SCO1